MHTWKGKEMSRSSSHSELLATDTQALGHQDSLSLPSEPPDIRNWFSSYIYESPELNTLDGFQDRDESGETCLEEEKNGDSYLVGKSNDILLAASKKSSDEFECRESAAMVTGSSESLSFSSEPADIKNWFSSYFYESPLLDTTHDFDYKEMEDGKLCNVQMMSCELDKKIDRMASIDVEEDSKELGNESRISDKCTNLVKSSKSQYQHAREGVDNVVLKPIIPSILNEMTCDKVTLSGNSSSSSSSIDGYVKVSGITTNTYGNNCDEKLDCNRKRGMMSLSSFGSRDKKSSAHRSSSLGRIDDGLEKEDITPGTLVPPKGDSLGEPTDRRRNGKENELQENGGFISIRKKTTGNITSGGVRGVDVESLRNAAKPPEIKHEIVRKVVLSEISNFPSPNSSSSSSTGKWCCPQKHKPNLGPRLKQLRLDQWLYRE